MPRPNAELAAALEHVEGWLSLGEAAALYEAARTARVPGPPVVVEIGSWKGRSTIALAAGLRARGEGMVHAIDPHVGTDEHRTAGDHPDTYETFLENVHRAGVASYVAPVRETSVQARPRFGDTPIDVLFVDGSHEYRDVVRDVRDWLPLLREHATVIFNDPLRPGVNRALRRHVLRPGTPCRRPRYLDNSLQFTWQPAAADDVSADLERLRTTSVLMVGGWWGRIPRPLRRRVPRGLRRSVRRLANGLPR